MVTRRLLNVLIGLVVLCGAGICRTAEAAIVVDGLVGDWGITPGPYSNGPSQWVPNAGISYAQEDQDPAVYFLGPGWGGQDFDVEAIYATQQGSTAYFAVVGGFPLSGLLGYTAGDLALDFGADGSYEFGVDTATGTLYQNPLWSTPLFAVSGPFDIISGTSLGPVGFGYQPGAYTANSHYAFEVGIPTSLFGSYWDGAAHDALNVHWTMSCGNDALDLQVQPEFPPPPVIPEPGSFLLLGMGLAGLGAQRRRSS